MAVKGAALSAKMADLLFASLYSSFHLPLTASNQVTFHCKNWMCTKHVTPCCLV